MKRWKGENASEQSNGDRQGTFLVAVSSIPTLPSSTLIVGLDP